jgi:hypothetical protein
MNVFGSRLRASEGAYFKSAAERELEELRRKRREEGIDEEEEIKIREISGAVDERAGGAAGGASSSSARTYAATGSATRGGVDKLASVYAEELRVGRRVPDTKLRRTVGTGVDAAFGRDGFVVVDHRHGGSVGGVPSVQRSIFDAHAGGKLNRRDWLREVSADLERAAAARRAMSPMERRALESSHMAQRHAFVSGIRALGYGSVLALLGVAGGSFCASAYLEIDTHADFARMFKATFEPYVERAREAAAPYKIVAASDGEHGRYLSERVASVESSPFVQSLRRKLGTKSDGSSGPF